MASKNLSRTAVAEVAPEPVDPRTEADKLRDEIAVTRVGGEYVLPPVPLKKEEEAK